MEPLNQPVTNEDLPIDCSLVHSNEEEGKGESDKDQEVHEIEEGLR